MDQFEREKRQREVQLKTMREATKSRVKVFGNYMPGNYVPTTCQVSPFSNLPTTMTPFVLNGLQLSSFIIL